MKRQRIEKNITPEQAAKVIDKVNSSGLTHFTWGRVDGTMKRICRDGVRYPKLEESYRGIIVGSGEDIVGGYDPDTDPFSNTQFYAAIARCSLDGQKSPRLIQIKNPGIPLFEWRRENEIKPPKYGFELSVKDYSKNSDERAKLGESRFKELVRISRGLIDLLKKTPGKDMFN